MQAFSYYSALPLLALALASQPVAAQNWSVPHRRPSPMSFLHNQDQQTYIRPVLPSLPEPVAALPVEPDTAVRRTYVREHVRSVVKLRLNEEGQVKDTIEFQEIDERGRRISQLRREAGWEERRHWSYDDADHCTSLVVYPSLGRNFTTIYTFNPALGRGRCEVLQANGKRTVVCEVQQQQHGDTLVTEACFAPAPVTSSAFQAEGCRRDRRFQVAPDTLVTLIDVYSTKGQLTGRQILYEFQRGGQPRERGQLDVTRAIRQYQRTGTSISPRQFPLAWVPRLLRTTSSCLLPNTITRYDEAGRPIHYETIGRSVTPVTTLTRAVTRNTYNDLNQLIGQQRRVFVPSVSNTTGYVVFSYQPNGLPASETSRASGPPLFYRYQYGYGR